MKLALVAVLSSGCFLSEDDSETKQQTSEVFTADVVSVDFTSVEQAPDDEADLCGLALELPRDNVCSMICDPEAFAARLVDGGMAGGRCYQLRCELPGGTTVGVGVCIP